MKYVFMTDASCDLTQKQADEAGASQYAGKPAEYFHA